MPRPFPVDTDPDIWHADELARPAGRVLATGHAALDKQLPGGGWPVGALVEILQAHSAQNEWRLLLPALERSGSGPVVLVGAPHMPFGPGLSSQGLAPERLLWIRAVEPAARMWACEQALRCTQVCVVLAWLPQARVDQLRRLQMAAGEHAKLLFVMRPARVQTESSPAVLRLLASLQPGGDGVEVDILKRRGPPAAQPVQMPARAGRLAALLARGRPGLRMVPGALDAGPNRHAHAVAQATPGSLDAGSAGQGRYPAAGSTAQLPGARVGAPPAPAVLTKAGDVLARVAAAA